MLIIHYKMLRFPKEQKPYIEAIIKIYHRTPVPNLEEIRRKCNVKLLGGEEAEYVNPDAYDDFLSKKKDKLFSNPDYRKLVELHLDGILNDFELGDVGEKVKEVLNDRLLTSIISFAAEAENKILMGQTQFSVYSFVYSIDNQDPLEYRKKCIEALEYLVKKYEDGTLIIGQKVSPLKKLWYWFRREYLKDNKITYPHLT